MNASALLEYERVLNESRVRIEKRVAASSNDLETEEQKSIRLDLERLTASLEAEQTAETHLAEILRNYESKHSNASQNMMATAIPQALHRSTYDPTPVHTAPQPVRPSARGINHTFSTAATTTTTTKTSRHRRAPGLSTTTASVVLESDDENEDVESKDRAVQQFQTRDKFFSADLNISHGAVYNRKLQEIEAQRIENARIEDELREATRQLEEEAARERELLELLKNRPIAVITETKDADSTLNASDLLPLPSRSKPAVQTSRRNSVKSNDEFFSDHYSQISTIASMRDFDDFDQPKPKKTLDATETRMLAYDGGFDGALVAALDDMQTSKVRADVVEREAEMLKKVVAQQAETIANRAGATEIATQTVRGLEEKLNYLTTVTEHQKAQLRDQLDAEGEYVKLEWVQATLNTLIDFLKTQTEDFNFVLRDKREVIQGIEAELTTVIPASRVKARCGLDVSNWTNFVEQAAQQQHKISEWLLDLATRSEIRIQRKSDYEIRHANVLKLQAQLDAAIVKLEHLKNQAQQYRIFHRWFIWVKQREQEALVEASIPRDKWAAQVEGLAVKNEHARLKKAKQNCFMHWLTLSRERAGSDLAAAKAQGTYYFLNKQLDGARMNGCKQFAKRVRVQTLSRVFHEWKSTARNDRVSKQNTVLDVVNNKLCGIIKTTSERANLHAMKMVWFKWNLMRHARDKRNMRIVRDQNAHRIGTALYHSIAKQCVFRAFNAWKSHVAGRLAERRLDAALTQQANSSHAHVMSGTDGMLRRFARHSMHTCFALWKQHTQIQRQGKRAVINYFARHRSTREIASSWRTWQLRIKLRKMDVMESDLEHTKHLLAKQTKQVAYARTEALKRVEYILHKQKRTNMYFCFSLWRERLAEKRSVQRGVIQHILTKTLGNKIRKSWHVWTSFGKDDHIHELEQDFASTTKKLTRELAMTQEELSRKLALAEKKLASELADKAQWQTREQKQREQYGRQVAQEVKTHGQQVAAGILRREGVRELEFHFLAWKHVAADLIARRLNTLERTVSIAHAACMRPTFHIWSLFTLQAQYKEASAAKQADDRKEASTAQQALIDEYEQKLNTLRNAEKQAREEASTAQQALIDEYEEKLDALRSAEKQAREDSEKAVSELQAGANEQLNALREAQEQAREDTEKVVSELKAGAKHTKTSGQHLTRSMLQREDLRVVQLHFVGWRRTVFDLLERRVTVIGKTCLMAQTLSLRPVFRQWTLFLVQARHADEQAALERELAAANAEQEKLRERLRDETVIFQEKVSMMSARSKENAMRLLQRWQKQELTSRFEHWQNWATQKRKRRVDIMRRVVVNMSARRVSSAWAQWSWFASYTLMQEHLSRVTATLAEQTENAKMKARKNAHALIRRWQKHDLVHFFALWKTTARQAIDHRCELMLRVVSRMGNALVWQSWRAWKGNVENAKVNELLSKLRMSEEALEGQRETSRNHAFQQAARMISRWQKQRLVSAFERWRANAEAQVTEKRVIMERCVTRMGHAAIWRSWRAWTGYVEQKEVAELRAQLSATSESYSAEVRALKERALKNASSTVRRWMKRDLTSYFRRWKQFAEAQLEHKALVMKRTVFRLAYSAQHQAFRKWTLHVEQLQLNAQVAALQKELSNTRSDMTQQLEIAKSRAIANARATVDKWRKQSLVFYFQTWQTHARDARAKRWIVMEKCLVRLRNSNTWRVWRVWTSTVEAAQVKELQRKLVAEAGDLQEALQHHKERARDRAIRLIHKWQKQSAALCFREWKRFTGEQKQRRNATMSRTLRKMVNRQLWQTWRVWSTRASAWKVHDRRDELQRQNTALTSTLKRVQGRARRNTEVMIKRWVNQSVAQAFRTWRDNVHAQLSYKRQVMGRCLPRMTNAALWQAWRSWTRFVTTAQTEESQQQLVSLQIAAKDQERKQKARARRNAERLISRWRKEGMVATFARWKLFTQQAQQERRAVMHRCLSRLLNHSLYCGWRAWTQSVENGKVSELRAKLEAGQNALHEQADREKQRALQQAQRMIRRWQKQSLVHSFEVWVHFKNHRRAHKRATMERCLSRMVNGNMWRAWRKWTGVVEAAEILDLQNRIVASSQEMQAERARAKDRATRQADTLMRRWAKQGLVACFHRWQQFTERQRIKKHALMSHCFTRLANSNLWQVWRTWNRHVEREQVIEMQTRLAAAKLAEVQAGHHDRAVSNAERMIRKWQRQGQALAFARWKQFTENNVRQKRNIMNRCLNRMVNNQIWRSWRMWQHSVEESEVEQLKNNLLQTKQSAQRSAKAMIHKWRTQNMKAYFEKWQEFVTTRQHRKETLTRKMLTRLINTNVWRVWRAWNAEVQERQIDELRSKMAKQTTTSSGESVDMEKIRARAMKNAERMIKRWHKGSMIRAFEHWKRWTADQHVRKKEMLHRIIRRMGNHSLWRVWRNWNAHVEAAEVAELSHKFDEERYLFQEKIRAQHKVARDRAERMIDRWQKQSLVAAFTRWHRVTLQERERKQAVLSRFLHRIMHHRTWTAWRVWSVNVETSRVNELRDKLQMANDNMNASAQVAREHAMRTAEQTIRRWRRQHLTAVFQRWVDFTETSLEKKSSLMKKCLHRMIHTRLWRPWRVWTLRVERDQVEKLQALLAEKSQNDAAFASRRAEILIVRWQRRGLVSCFNTWKSFSRASRARKVKVLDTSLRRMISARTWKVWRQWTQLVENAQVNEIRLQLTEKAKALKQEKAELQHRLSVSEAKISQQEILRKNQLMARVVRRMVNARVWSVWRGWQGFIHHLVLTESREVAKERAMVRAKYIIGKWQKDSLLLRFEQWRAFVQQRQELKKRVIPSMLARMMNKRVWRGWREWKQFVVQAQKADEAEAVRQQQQQMRTEQARLQATLKRTKTRARRNTEILIRRAVNQTLSNAFALWKNNVQEQLVYKRKVMTRCLSRMTNAAAWRVWRDWSQHVHLLHEAERDKQHEQDHEYSVMKRSMKRLMNARISSAWRAWQDHVATERFNDLQLVLHAKSTQLEKELEKQNRAIMTRFLRRLINRQMYAVWRHWQDHVSHQKRSEQVPRDDFDADEFAKQLQALQDALAETKQKQHEDMEAMQERHRRELEEARRDKNDDNDDEELQDARAALQHATKKLNAAEKEREREREYRKEMKQDHDDEIARLREELARQRAREHERERAWERQRELDEQRWKEQADQQVAAPLETSFQHDDIFMQLQASQHALLSTLQEGKQSELVNKVRSHEWNTMMNHFVRWREYARGEARLREEANHLRSEYEAKEATLNATRDANRNEPLQQALAEHHHMETLFSEKNDLVEFLMKENARLQQIHSATMERLLLQEQEEEAMLAQGDNVQVAPSPTKRHEAQIEEYKLRLAQQRSFQGHDDVSSSFSVFQEEVQLEQDALENANARLRDGILYSFT